MNFEFFESLSTDDARSFLGSFLRVENAAFLNVATYISDGSGPEEFTVRSIPTMLRNIVKNLTVSPTGDDRDLPEWLISLPSYSNDLLEFDEHSKSLVLLGAYYLGETFVRSFPTLSWQIGDPETALINMPVVSGFRHSLEMAPMLIFENLALGILVDGDELSTIDTTVAEWSSKVIT